MGISLLGKINIQICLATLIFCTISVGQDIENYEDLCRECQRHKDSYRLRGWVCWTVCGSTSTDPPDQHVTATEKGKSGIKPARTNAEKKNKSNGTKTEMYNTNWTLTRYLSDTYRQILLEPSKIIEVFKKARCIIPKDVDSISRALLLQQCLSQNQGQGNETVCYEDLGCFPMEKPWVSLFRPFPAPHTPDMIDVRLYLYTRKENEGIEVPLWPKIDLTAGDFDKSRSKNVFITHGFASNGNATWLQNMKDSYLKNEDANVFLVDWGKGASLFNYLQVASNTRIVGAELGRFGLYLMKLGVTPESLHLIGHSLGSHISAYMAKRLAKKGYQVARITALDPAQPGFEKEDKEVRLDHGDAEFIDVLHTDAKPFIPFIGFGLLLPVGHVDFYINDGTNQPGCLTNIKIGSIKSIYDLADVPVEVLSQWVSCSHGRAYQIFTEALHPENSCLWARKIPFYANLIKVTAMGALRLLDPLIHSWDNCTTETCTTLGLITSDLQARGIFSLQTTAQAPYCVTDEERDRKLKNVLSLGLFSIGSKIKDGLTSWISSVTGK